MYDHYYRYHNHFYGASVKPLLVFLLASVVYAEPLKVPMAFYASAAALDLHSTYNVLQFEKKHEANPLGRWLEDQPVALVAFSAATDATTVYLLHRWVGKRHPRFEKVALYVAGAVRIAAAAHNYTNTNGAVRKS